MKHKLFILFVLLFAPLYVNVFACGFGPMAEEYRFWMFQPNLNGIKQFQPFTFSTDKFYLPGGDYFYNDLQVKDTSFYAINVDEWYNLTGKIAQKKDIHTLIYNTSPKDFTSKKWENNTFFQALKRKENAAFLEYFKFAKECEAVFNVKIKDEWGSEMLGIGEENALEKVLTMGNTLFQKTKQEEIRLRVAFQLMKLNYFLGNKDKVNELYDKTVASSKSKSWIKNAAIYYKAIVQDGANYHYWLSRTFDLSIDKRFRSVQLFDNQNISPTINLAKNNHEKAVIYLMKGLQDPSKAIDLIQKVYSFDPTYSDFPMLISREINKIEDWLFTNKLTSFDAASEYLLGWEEEEIKYKRLNYEMDIHYAQKLLAFERKVLEDGKQTDKGFHLLSAAYLAMLTNDYMLAKSYLTQAESEKNIAPNVQIQLNLVALLTDLQMKNKIDESTENAILAFYNHIEKNKSQITDYDTFYGQVMLYLAKTYEEMDNFPKAMLLLSKTNRVHGFVGYSYKNFYHELLEKGKPADFDGVIRLIEKKQKSPFETFLTSNPKAYDAYWTKDWVEDAKTGEYKEIDLNKGKGWDLNKIKDFKATYYVNRDELDSAYAIIKTIPSNYWAQQPYHTMLNCNAFFVNVNNAHFRKATDSIKPYNKATFLKKVLDLKQEIKQNPAKKAYNNYLLGNAYFNMTWHGNFWLMNKIWWSTGEMDYNLSDDLTDNKLKAAYYGCKLAESYYLAAFENCSSNEKELAALCSMMAGKCNENYQHYLWSIEKKRSYEETFEAPKNNPYASAFNKRFNASILEQLNSNCDTYLDYIQRFNQ